MRYIHPPTVRSVSEWIAAATSARRALVRRMEQHDRDCPDPVECLKMEIYRVGLECVDADLALLRELAARLEGIPERDVPSWPVRTAAPVSLLPRQYVEGKIVAAREAYALAIEERDEEARRQAATYIVYWRRLLELRDAAGVTV